MVPSFTSRRRFSLRSVPTVVLAFAGLIGAATTSFGVALSPVSARPSAIFSENFNAMTQNGLGTQADTALTVGAWGSATGWEHSGVNTIHSVDRILGSGVDIAATFYNNNQITLASGFAANELDVSYSVTFDVGPSVWAASYQASNASDGLVVEILRPAGTVLASSSQLAGAWNGTTTAQDAMTSRSFTYLGDGSGVVRLKISTINPSADRFGGAIDNIVVQVSPIAECTPVSINLPSAGDVALKFTTVGQCNWTVPSGVSTVEALVVGGGGGGSGGGGGAGGVLHSPTLSVTGGQDISVRVGDGGAGSAASTDGVNGQGSRFNTVEAFGGGGGGRQQSGGLAGASSGGAGQDSSAEPGASSQGFPGATGPSNDAATGAGGGGGAGSAGIRGALYSEYSGSQRTPGGNGGDGRAFATSGTSTYYGGGGGGGANNNTEPTVEYGHGGLGGGGNGTNANLGNGEAGLANTGGGGGGGDWEGSGAQGGSGIVIVRYSVPSAPVNTEVPTISGTKRVGETLTAAFGSWSGSPTSYSYQWKRATTSGGIYSNIGIASSVNTYVLTDDDADKFIKVSVVATNINGPSAAELSVATPAISTVPIITSTTVPSTVTTVKAAVTIDIQAPVSTVAQGQASVATIAPGGVQASASPMTTVVASNQPMTTTSLAPVVQQTSITLAPPVIPSVKTGESAFDLGGVKAPVAITRENNQIVIKAGALSARLSGLGKNGTTSPLDKDGNLQLEPGDVIRINVGGFKPGSDVDVWFFSTPTHLGSTTVGADGTVSGAFTVPAKIEDGPHRIAITAKLENGKQATFTLGVRVGAIPKTSTLTRILIAIPILLAILVGLMLPGVLRRRRTED